MNDAPQKFWFPAKRYGWGWGLPATWQGWAVLAIFHVFVFAGIVFFVRRGDDFKGLLIYLGLLIAALMLICWMKGEKPGWRWGDKQHTR